MRKTLETVLRNYGGTVEAVAADGTARSFRAFVQLVTSKSWQNMERVLGPLGEVPRGQYLYLGPAGEDVNAAEYLRFDGAEYVVRRAELLYVGDEPLYVWGLCVRKGADDPWSS